MNQIHQTQRLKILIRKRKPTLLYFNQLHRSLNQPLSSLSTYTPQHSLVHPLSLSNQSSRSPSIPQSQSFINANHQSNSNSSFYEPYQTSPSKDDAPSALKHSQSEALEVLPEDQLESESTKMPELPDIAALKPARLNKYLPGMQRIWYIDQVNSITKRLMRAFNRPQLEHATRILGFTQSHELILSTKGKQRLRSLKLQHPGLSIKDLTVMVLSESKTEFETWVKRKDPTDSSYSKKDLVSFIVFEHWGLTNPKKIPLQENFTTLAKDFQSNSKLFMMPYHEIFLLYLDQTRSPERNFLAYLAQKNDVSVELNHEPSGLMVHGQMKNRESFWKSFEKIRKVVHKDVIQVSDHLSQLYLTPQLLKNLSELSGCYLESRPQPEENSTLLAYSYESETIAERVLDALTQLYILSSGLRDVPVLISTKNDEQLDQDSAELAVIPFLPGSNPSWYIASATNELGRLSYPTNAISGPSREITLETGAFRSAVLDHLDILSSRDVQLFQHLSSITTSPELGPLQLTACFGHYLFPRPNPSSCLGPSFGAGGTQLNAIKSWLSLLKLVPAFFPAPLTRAITQTTIDFESSLNRLDGDEASNRSSSAGETLEIQVFQPVDLEAISSSTGVRVLYEIIKSANQEFHLQKVLRTELVILLPDRPMDLMIRSERRGKIEILETESISDLNPMKLLRDGQKYILVDKFDSTLINKNQLVDQSIEFENLRVNQVFSPNHQILNRLQTHAKLTLRDENHKDQIQYFINKLVSLTDQDQDHHHQD